MRKILRLGKPNGIVLYADIEIRFSIIVLIEDETAVSWLY
jgi:hypothetical protein